MNQKVDGQVSSDKLYKAFLRNFDGMVLSGTIDHKPILACGKIKQITGYTEKDFLDGNVFWENLIIKEDFVKFKATIPHLLHKKGFSAEREFRIMHKDGSIRWVRERIHNLCDRKGKVTTIQGIITDVTEQHRTRDALQTSTTIIRELVYSVPELMVVLDRDLRVIMSNWHGVPDINQKNGMPHCYKVFMKRNEPCPNCPVLRVFATGNSSCSFVTNPLNDIRRQVLCYPVYDNKGRVELVVENVRGVNAKKRDFSK